MTKYKYNDDSIIAGYIRELLHDFNLPAYKVYKGLTKNGYGLYDGRRYINDGYIVAYDQYKKEDGKVGGFNRILQYIFGSQINNVTMKLPIDSSIYDTVAHIYLGNYLRFLRDAKNIDLMPLYNCNIGIQGTNFNYAVEIPRYDLHGKPIDSYLFNVNTDDRVNDYYLALVKFGYDYTIAIDALVPFEVCCIINTGDKVLYDSKKLAIQTYKRYTGASYRYPVIYNTDIDATLYWQYEENLLILIKVPKMVKSSLTVLEGDYTLNCETIGGRLMPHSYKQLLTPLSPLVSSDVKIISKLSLLRINTLQSYPFANRLVEYLLGNAITSDETIKCNVKRVQDKIYNDPNAPSVTFKGFEDIWDKNIFQRINEILLYDNRNDFVKLRNMETKEETQTKLRNQDVYFDLLGYVDRDIEYIIEAW